MARRKQNIQEAVPKLRQLYVYFWPQIRKYRLTIAGSLTAMFAAVVFRLLEPWPIKIFLDYVLPAGREATLAKPEQDFLAPWLADVTPHTLLAAVAIGTVLIVALRSGCDYVSRVGFFVVGNKVVIRVRERLYRHLQRLSLQYHNRARMGDLIVRVTRDVSLVRDVTATAVLPLLASIAVLFGMLVVMSFLSWQLTLLSLVTVPLFWLTTIRLSKRIRETARRQRQREGAMATTAAEALGAMRLIKSMRLEERFAASFAAQNAQSQKEDLKASRLSVRLGRTIDVLLAGSTAIVLWVGGKLALNGQLSAGDIIVFITYLKRSFKPAQGFAKYVARLAKAAASGERVIEVLETAPDIVDAEDAQEAPPFSGIVSFEGVTFGYDAGDNVLHKFELKINAGELLCLVGPSGAGKTTALGLLLRLFEPQHGRVTIDGHDLSRWTVASLRAQTSSVMQEPMLLADTIAGNIACGAVDTTEDDIVEAAKLASAHEFILQLPGGYESAIGERGATLSRGQQQRIAIARAALRRTPILLLDEPTSGLDEESEAIVVDALLRLAKGRTTLLVTHNLKLAAEADRICFLDRGRIIESGSHAELIGQAGRYATWFAQQQTRSNRNKVELSVVS